MEDYPDFLGVFLGDVVAGVAVVVEVRSGGVIKAFTGTDKLGRVGGAGSSFNLDGVGGEGLFDVIEDDTGGGVVVATDECVEDGFLGEGFGADHAEAAAGVGFFGSEFEVFVGVGNADAVEDVCGVALESYGQLYIPESAVGDFEFLGVAEVPDVGVAVEDFEVERAVDGEYVFDGVAVAPVGVVEVGEGGDTEFLGLILDEFDVGDEAFLIVDEVYGGGEFADVECVDVDGGG